MAGNTEKIVLGAIFLPFIIVSMIYLSVLFLAVPFLFMFISEMGAPWIITIIGYLALSATILFITGFYFKTIVTIVINAVD